MILQLFLRQLAGKAPLAHSAGLRNAPFRPIRTNADQGTVVNSPIAPQPRACSPFRARYAVREAVTIKPANAVVDWQILQADLTGLEMHSRAETNERMKEIDKSLP